MNGLRMPKNKIKLEYNRFLMEVFINNDPSKPEWRATLGFGDDIQPVFEMDEFLKQTHDGEYIIYKK